MISNQQRLLPLLLTLVLAAGCGGEPGPPGETSATGEERQRQLAEQILDDQGLSDVLTMAKELLATGFNAGSGYVEVWIRDLATFIEISCDVLPQEDVREALLLFFHFQGADGNIVDGLTPAAEPGAGYDFIYSESAPNHKAHKNTVASDQESSLVQAVATYVRETEDDSILTESIGGRSVRDRLGDALQYLLDHRWAEEFGLIWGGATIDWGDVRPDHEWGVVLEEDSHRAVDVYDNAMLLIAIDDYLSLLPADSEASGYWREVHERIARNVRSWLWDAEREQFKAHLYLDGSPFPEHVDESQIYYHGGTTLAIAAGLLSRDEIEASLARMVENVRLSGAPSIGLTIYPPYPAGIFENPILNEPFTYQNGGDWTWFGGRTVQQLVAHGLVEEAYREIQPMVDRVLANGGFWEWYSKDNEPSGHGTFRGSAGALGLAIERLRAWAAETVAP